MMNTMGESHVEILQLVSPDTESLSSMGIFFWYAALLRM
jgi:hypothetical protein